MVSSKNKLKEKQDVSSYRGKAPSMNPYLMGDDLYLWQELAATFKPNADKEEVLECLIAYGDTCPEDEEEKFEDRVAARLLEIAEEEQASHEDDKKETMLSLAERIDTVLHLRLTEGDFRMCKRLLEPVFREFGVGEPLPVKKTPKNKKALDKKTVRG